MLINALISFNSMAENPLLKKLRLKPGNRVLLLHAEPIWESIFLPENAVENTPEGTYDFILFFAPDKATLDELAPVVRQAATPETIVWAAFYKGTSKVHTDLTRDKGWESMPSADWQFLTLVSLDEQWSAFGFRLAGIKVTKSRRTLQNAPSEAKPANPFIDSVNKIVELPEDLAEALAQNEVAATQYDKLAFSHRKEYVLWVTEAKRTETREKRIRETLIKLAQGFKKPSDKGA